MVVVAEVVKFVVSLMWFDVYGGRGRRGGGEESRYVRLLARMMYNRDSSNNYRPGDQLESKKNNLFFFLENECENW